MRKHGIVEATVEAHVAFHDVDVAGVVWHGHYLKYLENARWALMARLDFGLEAMIASGYAWPIVDVHVKYALQRPALRPGFAGRVGEPPGRQLSGHERSDYGKGRARTNRPGRRRRQHRRAAVRDACSPAATGDRGNER